MTDGGCVHDDTIAVAVEQTALHYETHVHELALHTRQHDVAQLSAPFRTLLPPPARLLDAGCGAGYAGRFFLDCGYHVTAIDQSAAFVTLATATIGQPARQLALQEL